MKKKPEKQKDLEALRAEFDKAETVFLAGYEKMTVAQDFALRKTVRGAGGSYKVVKNTIAGKALDGYEVGTVAEWPEGYVLGRLHLRRSCGAGQGADSICEGESGLRI